MNITEKYLKAIEQYEGWLTVSEWAVKVGEHYPDLLEKANREAEQQANDTTGLREIGARVSSAIARGAYIDRIEIDATERPRKIRYVSAEEHQTLLNEELEEDVAPLKRGEIIARDQQTLSTNELYRIAEFENISKNLKQFFGLEFEIDHAQALLNEEQPGRHHPDNLQLLLKVHNGKKNKKNWFPKFNRKLVFSYPSILSFSFKGWSLLSNVSMNSILKVLSELNI